MTIRKASKVLLASAARTATPTDVDIDFGDDRNTSTKMDNIANIHVIIDVTAAAATPSVAPQIVAVDPASGDEYDLLASITAITGVGTTVLRIGRDIISAAGLSAQDFLPGLIRLKMTHADADSITYSVGINAEFEPVQ